ncbi:MAG: hypothetical protein WBC93_17150 [Sulfitobacter sp.]
MGSNYKNALSDITHPRDADVPTAANTNGAISRTVDDTSRWADTAAMMKILDLNEQPWLNPICARFISVLNLRLDRMENQWDAMCVPSTRVSALKVIQVETQNIVGTARAVGYCDLGMLAMSLDQGISDYLSGQTDPGTFEVIERMTDGLIVAAARIVRTHLSRAATA